MAVPKIVVVGVGAVAVLCAAGAGVVANDLVGAVTWNGPKAVGVWVGHAPDVGPGFKAGQDLANGTTAPGAPAAPPAAGTALTGR